MKYIHSTLFSLQGLLQASLIGLFLLSDWNDTVQAIVCGVLLCSVGIPHGANDHLYRQSTTVSGLVKFTATYLGIMGVYLAIWWLAPALALFIFFIISLHHFGQSNFENVSVWYLPSLLWGTWLLAFPVIIHWEEAMRIFSAMLNSGSKEVALPELWRWSIGIFLALSYSSVLAYYEPKDFGRYALQWILITTWYWVTPLLFGFIVVFCLWHSLQSLQHQLTYFQTTQKGTLLQFIKALLPFGLLALTGFGIYVYYRCFVISEAFILLSLITLPHILVMHRLYGVVQNEGSVSLKPTDPS